MLGKIFKKKEDQFFMAMPEGASAVEAPAAVAPTIAAKTESQETPEAIAPAPAAPTPVATASSTDASAIIATALSAYSAAATTPKEVETFADKYLVNAGNNTSRRRPGVNMTAFMGMAKNVRR